MEVRPGDIVQLRKVHPCGSDRWQVVRVGAVIGIRCQRCHRRVTLDRATFERRVRAVLPQAGEGGSVA